jgi:hypothetical protein
LSSVLASKPLDDEICFILVGSPLRGRFAEAVEERGGKGFRRAACRVPASNVWGG